MPTFEDLYKARLTRELNNSDTSNLFTSTRRQQAINDAVEEFADLTECYTRQSSITVSCNTTEYSLLSSASASGLGSTDFVRLAKQGVEYRVRSSGSTWTWVTWLTGDDFPRRDIVFRNKYDSGWRTSTTPMTPTGYYLRDSGGTLQIGLDRNPKVGSSQLAELTVSYVARPVAMTSSGDVPFTLSSQTRTDLIPYHRALPHFAAYKLLPLVGDVQGAAAQLSQFMAFVAKWVQAQRPKGGTVTTLHNYFSRGTGEYEFPGVSS